MPDLADLAELIPDAIIDMRYTTERNIAHQPISDIVAAQMIIPAAEALRHVADTLRDQGYRLIIWDAYRTAEVQSKLRNLVDDERYVLTESLHPQGKAVDLTLADRQGAPLDMGTDHDDFTERAHADASNLTENQTANRRLLSSTMEANGFFAQWPYEWWHFDYVDK